MNKKMTVKDHHDWVDKIKAEKDPKKRQELVMKAIQATLNSKKVK